MSNVMELSLRGASNLEKLMRAVLLDSENKVPSERLRIVGAIAEGAVMESGSNSNGQWIRYADGTQVCICDLSVAITNIYGPRAGGIYMTNIDFTFPANFITPPAAAAASIYISGIYIWANARQTSTSGGALYSFYTDKPDTDLVQRFSIIAIGRWKA